MEQVSLPWDEKDHWSRKIPFDQAILPLAKLPLPPPWYPPTKPRQEQFRRIVKSRWVPRRTILSELITILPDNDSSDDDSFLYDKKVYNPELESATSGSAATTARLEAALETRRLKSVNQVVSQA